MLTLTWLTRRPAEWDSWDVASIACLMCMWCIAFGQPLAGCSIVAVCWMLDQL